MKKAVAYYRTSSSTGVGEDKDSERRQRDSCEDYARRYEIQIVAEYYDAAVSGADPVQDRPGFSRLLDEIANNQATVILVENASRFARDLGVQMAAHEMLQRAGIEIIPVDCPQHFTDTTPTAELVRNILGSVAMFERKNLVEKMKRGRERKRATTGRCEGRPPVPMEARMKAMQMWNDGLSLRRIGVELSAMGYMPYQRAGIRAGVFKAGSVKRMLK